MSITSMLSKSRASTPQTDRIEDRSYLATGDFVYKYKSVPIINRSEGVFLYDIEGRCFLDAESANGSALLGYDASLLKAALERAAKMPSAPVFCETDLRIRVATRLGKMIEEATGLKGRVAFELGGAQAMELAVRIAKSYRGSGSIAVFEGGYHGRSIYTSELSASARYRELASGVSERVLRLPYPDCSECRFGKHPSSCEKECVTYVKGLLRTEYAGLASNDSVNVCAFVYEPILNAGGIVRPDTTYLESTVDEFRRRGAVIIADEVFCGFKRTGKLFGFQHFNVVPDIIVLSKAMTNGLLPFSCVWARDPILAADCFPPGSHSATQINNVLGLAVTDAVLDRHAAWGSWQDDVEAVASLLRAVVESAAAKFDFVKGGQVIGGMARLVLSKPIAKEVVDIARLVAVATPIDGIHGVMLSSSALAPNVVAISPPLAFGSEPLRALEPLLIRTLEQVAKL